MDPVAGTSVAQTGSGRPSCAHASARPSADTVSRPETYRHVAAAVSSSDEAVGVAAAVVEEGLRRGDLPVLGCVPETADAVRRVLGTGLGTVEDDARICLVGARAPDAVAAVRRLLERARQTGSGRLLVLAEPQYGVDPRRWREVQRYESASNAFMAGLPVTAVCLYDRAQLPDDVVGSAWHTHPHVLADGGRVVGNREFRSPGAYLRDLSVVREPVEAGEPVYAVDGAPSLPSLRGGLRRAFGELVPDGDQRADLHLAVSEVAANAFRHGRLPVSARVWADGTRIVCTVTDSGTSFDDPLAGFVPAHGDDLAAGGMGLWLARKLWDSVDLLRGEHGLTVRLSSGLVAAADRAGAA